MAAVRLYLWRALLPSAAVAAASSVYRSSFGTKIITIWFGLKTPSRCSHIRFEAKECSCLYCTLKNVVRSKVPRFKLLGLLFLFWGKNYCISKKSQSVVVQSKIENHYCNTHRDDFFLWENWGILQKQVFNKAIICHVVNCKHCKNTAFVSKNKLRSINFHTALLPSLICSAVLCVVHTVAAHFWIMNVITCVWTHLRKVICKNNDVDHMLQCMIWKNLIHFF